LQATHAQLQATHTAKSAELNQQLSQQSVQLSAAQKQVLLVQQAKQALEQRLNADNNSKAAELKKVADLKHEIDVLTKTHRQIWRLINN
jgi:hypothetical protein